MTPLPALLSIADMPLLPPAAPRPVPAGTRISDLVRLDAPAMVKVDGQWILREQWAHALQPGQHMEVHVLPAGNDGRKALQLVLTIAALVYAPQLAGQWLLSSGASLGSYSTYLAITQIGLLTAINLLLPLKAPELSGLAQSGSPSYNTNLSGNRARLNEPIPVIYGRHQCYPPFAADPYSVYVDNDQYYHALMCIGMGEHEIEAVDLDDTDLAHFADVQYNVLPPGTAPTLVLANVVTAVEVADLPINAGRASPAIAACRGGLEATALGFDVVFPGGLGDATGGTVTNFSVDVRFDWRPLDDWGVPIGVWQTLAIETITDASTEPVRRSFYYELGSDGPARPECRVVRTTPRDEDPLMRNDAFWTGLRAYLDQDAPLCAQATYLEVKMRATEQLNGVTQRRIAVIARRLLDTWDPDGGWSSGASFTRNPAWAIVDKLRDTVYGNALPDARIDLDTFYALALEWDERQDNLDIVFDQVLDSDEADQIMARAGRARCYWRNGVRTIVRDEPQTLPAAALSGRDIVPGSTLLTYNTDAARVPDGIIVQYLAHRSWAWEEITCPAPGVTEPTRPQYMRLLGVTGAYHAEREGLYEAAAIALRRKITTVTTELQGQLLTYGSLVQLSLPLRGWGQHGDVVSWDSGTLEMVLTEPPTWGDDSSAHFITLVRTDGTVHDAIEVTEGGDAYTVVLAEAPDFTPVTDDARRERTRFIFGNTAEHRRMALVTGVTPQEVREDGAMLIEVATINDDDAIHEADVHLLPSSSDEVQDPIDSPNEEGPPDGEIFIAYLTDRTVSDDAPAGGGTAGVLLRLTTDGRLQFVKTYTGPGQTTTVANQWILGSPVGESDVADFEVYATEVSGTVDSGTVGAWITLDTQREWAISVTGDGNSQAVSLRLQIRDAGGLVQAEGTFNLSASIAEFGGGD